MKNLSDEKPPSPDSKTLYYQNQTIADRYDDRRFGEKTGEWVQESEENTIEFLMNRMESTSRNRALDLPTGTGRLIPLLRKRFDCVLACDLSPAMLQKAKLKNADYYFQATGSQLMLKSHSIDFILASRFIFHFADPSDYLKEMNRVLKQNAYLLFDVYNWTPRMWIPGNQEQWGGRVHVHPKRKIDNIAHESGFRVVDFRAVFVITPYLYRYLPFFFVKWIEALGSWFLPKLKTKTYYLLQKK
jgi:ubiquinone/menaquinone biosynthesis C-methylase UbiE